jgi:acetyl esterase
MRNIPKEKAWTRETLQKRVNLVRTLMTITPGAHNPNRIAGQELFLDTGAGKVRVLGYHMEKPEILPLFIDIHGGGFVMGQAEMDDPYLMNVADKANLKILSIDYSLAPDAVFPTALNECYNVIKYAREHAGDLGIDPDNIALGGHSAGGNLSAAICLKDAEAKTLGIKCLILDYPPLDVYTDPYCKPQPKGALPPGLCRIFNGCYCNCKEERKNPLISPAFASIEQLKSFPPTLIITASRDSLCQEAEDFRDKLIQAGVAVTHKRFEGSLHGFTLSDKPDAMEGWQMMIDHLKRHLQYR